MTVIDRIIAETTTNAFSQINLTKTLTGWPIPTFGCTIDKVVVFMYDPKNDVLLQSTDLISFWRTEQTLDHNNHCFHMDDVKFSHLYVQKSCRSI